MNIANILQCSFFGLLILSIFSIRLKHPLGDVNYLILVFTSFANCLTSDDCSPMFFGDCARVRKILSKPLLLKKNFKMLLF